MMLVRTIALFAFIAASAACGGKRPGHDITAETADALARGDRYDIRPRTLSRFDCICVFTSYEDDSKGTMESLSRSRPAADCDVRSVPLDLDDSTGVFLLIDRGRRPSRLEVQSFDRGAVPALSALTTVYRGCQRAVRARVTDRSGHNPWETFLQ